MGLVIIFFFIINNLLFSANSYSNFINNSTLVVLSSLSKSDFPWRPSQNRILVSPKSTFAAGFLPTTITTTTTTLKSPNNHALYTFSIYYYNTTINHNKKSIVVWSANPYSPVRSSDSLTVDESTGELHLSISSNNYNSNNLWPQMMNSSSDSKSKLVLHDTGNLVFGSSWESFDFPTDTILPNQIISNKTELVSPNRKFRFSGGSSSLTFNGSGSVDAYWSSSSPLVELSADGILILVQLQGGQSFVSSDAGVIRLRRLTLADDGNLRIYSFDPDRRKWVVVWRAVQEICRVHGLCGPNSICTPSGQAYHYKYIYYYGGASVSESDSDSDAIINYYNCVCPPGYRRQTRPTDSNSDSSYSCEMMMMTTTPSISNHNNILQTKFIRLDYVNFTSDQTIMAVDADNLTACQSMCYANPNCLGFGFKYDGTLYCSLQIGSKLLNGYWSPGTQAAMFLRVVEEEEVVDTHTNKSSLSSSSSFSMPSSMSMTSCLTNSCPVKTILPHPHTESSTRARNIAIVTALFSVELLIGALSFWAFSNKYIKYIDMARSLGHELLLPFPSSATAGGKKRFSYSEIRAATADFSTHNMIGRGGFSDVYRGDLPDGRTVAIKCLKNHNHNGDADFWGEVTIIARMHHLNLVRLWGFCNEKGHRILVYEHISNGSLDKFLFHYPPPCPNRNSSNNTSDNNNISSSDNSSSINTTTTTTSASTSSNNTNILDLNTRYRIALGVARAIAYLHEECLDWVLHCDIKPENILLGDDFCPKVADFGLSKLRNKEQVVSMSRIRGTRGYLAPEWVKNEPISSKADVYSFGMVLLEMVAGARNTVVQDHTLDNSADWYLPRWAFHKVVREMRVEDVLDPRINTTSDTINFELDINIVDRMVKTAIWCVQEKPEARPSMGKVAKMLEGTVEIIDPPKPTIFYIADDY